MDRSKSSHCTAALARLAFGACLALPAVAQQPTLPRHDPGAAQPVPATTLATWPEKTFLESVIALPDGGWIVANKDGARIERVAADGTVRLLAALPEGLTGIELGPQGEIYATGRVKGKPETVYRVDAGGKVDVFVEVPQAKFLNGMTRIAPHTLLIADSGAKTLWKLDLVSRTVSPWLVHDLLGHRDPAHAFPTNTWIPGANGVKRFKDWIYASSTDRGLMLRIPIRADGSAGEPAIWAKDVVVDDFALDADGNVYGTSHPLHTVVRIRSDGSRATIATGAEGVVGATAAAFGVKPGDEHSLYIVGDAKVKYLDDFRQAKLVRLDLDVPGAPLYSFLSDRARVHQVGRLETFLVTAQTQPGFEAERTAAAPAYTTYLEQNLDRLVLGAQILDKPGGAAAARMYFLRAPDAESARALIEASPYAKVGVYRVTDVKPATGMLGELMGGVVWPPRTVTP